MSLEPANDCQGYPPIYLKDEPKEQINFYLPTGKEDHHLACSWITPPKSSFKTNINHKQIQKDNNNNKNIRKKIQSWTHNRKNKKEKEKQNNNKSSIIDTINPLLTQIDTTKHVFIICHGFLSWRNQMVLANLAVNLSNELSCHTLRFDFSGNGHSSGKWSFGSYEQDYEDLCVVYDFVKDVMRCNVHCIIGHSQGSAAILKHAALIDSRDVEDVDVDVNDEMIDDGTDKEIHENDKDSNGRSNSDDREKPFYVSLAGRRCKTPTLNFQPETIFTTHNNVMNYVPMTRSHYPIKEIEKWKSPNIALRKGIGTIYQM